MLQIEEKEGYKKPIYEIKKGYFFFPLFYIEVLINIVAAVQTKEKQKVNDEGLQKLRAYLCKGTN